MRGCRRCLILLNAVSSTQDDTPRVTAAVQPTSRRWQNPIFSRRNAQKLLQSFLRRLHLLDVCNVRSANADARQIAIEGHASDFYSTEGHQAAQPAKAI